MKKISIVKLKTQKELLETGWFYDSEQEHFFKNKKDMLTPLVTKDMFGLLGKVIKIEEDEDSFNPIVVDCLKCSKKDIEIINENYFEIPPDMISKIYDNLEYPEMLVFNIY